MLQNTQEETITATTINRKFGDIAIGLLQGKKYVLERNGTRLGAVVPMHVYDTWKRNRDDFFAQIQSLQQKANLDSETADELAFKAVQKVRKGH